MSLLYVVFILYYTRHFIISCRYCLIVIQHLLFPWESCKSNFNLKLWISLHDSKFCWFKMSLVVGFQITINLVAFRRIYILFFFDYAFFLVHRSWFEMQIFLMLLNSIYLIKCTRLAFFPSLHSKWHLRWKVSDLNWFSIEHSVNIR